MQAKLDCIRFVSLGNLAPVLPEISEPLWIFIVLLLLFIREEEIRESHQM